MSGWGSGTHTGATVVAGPANNKTNPRQYYICQSNSKQKEGVSKLTGVCADGGERRSLARALDVREALTRGQVCGLRGGGGGDGDDLGAVDERADVLPEHGHFGHCGGEFGHHGGLVGWGCG